MKRMLNYLEEDMQKALAACKAGGTSVRKAAQTFNVPRSTLQTKVNGTAPETRKMGPATVLSRE